MKLALVGISILISAIVSFYYKSGYCEEVTKAVCFKNACVNSEIADSEDKRKKGLMFRKSLDENSGMLFIFSEEERYGFWMKNMNFPLDIIWISRDKKIIDITKDIPPCVSSCETIFAREQAKYVLEVKSGFADKYQIKIGDAVNLE